MTQGASRNVYMQQALDAYAAGRLDEARSASESLLSIGGLDETWLAAALRNAVFYAPRLREIVPGHERRQAPPSQERLIARDPSPAMAGGRLIALVDEGYVPGAPLPRVAISGLELDASGEVRSRVEMLAAGGQETARCRLAALGEGCVALCAWLPHMPAAVVMPFDPGAPMAGQAVVVTDAAGAAGPEWMPFDRNGELLLVTGVHPLRVVRALESGAVEALAAETGPPILGRLAGGSPGVWFGDGWLFALRQVAVFEDGNRVVLHRFAILGDLLSWTHLSPPFRFGDGDDRLEHCAGLALAGDRLIAGVGVEDREAWFHALPISEVRAMLRPIAEWEDPERPLPREIVSMRGLLGREMPPLPGLLVPTGARPAALAGFAAQVAARRPAAPVRHPARLRTPPPTPSPAVQYREALRLLDSGTPRAAEQVCREQALAAGETAELPWLAAYACWLAGDDARAVEMAGIAGSRGWSGGRTAPASHEMTAAWFEGPADIERHALRRLGADAAAADRRFAEAFAARTAWEAERAAGAPGEREES
ncbi:MAG: hypothetical protein ACKOWF_03175 [Chloroflexota bacterium]